MKKQAKQPAKSAKKTTSSSSPRAKQADVRRSAAKSVAKKAAAKKFAAPKAVAKKAVAKKAVAKKAVAKKAAAKKVGPKKAATKKANGKPISNSKADLEKTTSKSPSGKAATKSHPVKPAGKAVAKKTAGKKVVVKAGAPSKTSPKKEAASKLPENKLASKSPSTLSDQNGGIVGKIPQQEKSTITAVDTTTKIHPGQPARTGLDPSKPGKIARAIIRPNINKDKKPVVSNKSVATQTAAPDLLEKDEGADPGFFQTDEVFDETDYAQHLQLMEQAEVSRRARELNRPQTHPDFDGEHCIECDIQIPLMRLQAGRIRCVDCQEEVENEDRRTQNLSKGRGF